MGFAFKVSTTFADNAQASPDVTERIITAINADSILSQPGRLEILGSTAEGEAKTVTQIAGILDDAGYPASSVVWEAAPSLV